MSSGQYKIPISLAIIVIILCRNSFRLRLRTNVNSASYLPYTVLPTGSSHGPVSINPHIRTMMLHGTSTGISISCPIYFATDDSGDKGSGDQSTDDGKGPEPPEETKENPQEEEPRQKPKKSRIPTYDEFARFKDSSRPPDSHYSSEPVNFGCDDPKPSFLIMVCCLFLMFVI